MKFLVNIPYRESKNRNKRFNVEYEIRAENTIDALEIAKNKFNSYENFNFAAWERFMFEDEIKVSPLLNGKVFRLEMYQEFLNMYPGFADDEKFFFLNQLSELQLEEKCILYYDFIENEKNPRIKSFLVAVIGKNRCTTDYMKLAPFLEDPDSRVRANTIETLESFGVKELIPQFMSLLADANNRVRANAIKALWKLGEKDIEVHVLKMLKSYNSLMKSSALYVLGEIDFPGSVEIILDHMKDEDELVRFNAGRSLFKTIKLEDLPKISSFIGTEDDIVRLYIKKCFVKFSADAAEVLLKMKSEDDDFDWESARDIIREIEDDRLKSGDRKGFFRIMLKRMFHIFRL